MESAEDFRTGYAALVGAPNVGKSTLMNAVLKQKISIVTKKPQTTRHKIAGILSGGNYQIIFLDTPGLITPKYLLQEAMMKFASSALDDADVVLFLVDAEKAKSRGVEKSSVILERIPQAERKTIILVVNKIDCIGKDDVFPLIENFHKAFSFHEIMPISALNSSGTEELVSTIVSYLPKHPPLYPPDIISEAPEKFFVSEIIREKIFEQFSEEIPYSTAVDIVAFKERANKKHFISAEIFVERQSQKGILIGKSGAALKKVGELARAEIESFLDHPVFLELHVKVREKWRGSEAWLKRLGYGN
ncbi:MAG: GTPase Era [Bacteroidota bacterium]|nr:GTPase Era [Bacteroidota bacterium]